MEVCDATLFGVKNFPWIALFPRRRDNPPSKTAVTIYQAIGYNISEDFNFQVVTKQTSTKTGCCGICYGWARVVALLHSIQTDSVASVYSRYSRYNVDAFLKAEDNLACIISPSGAKIKNVWSLVSTSPHSSRLALRFGSRTPSPPYIT
jgi:hypothetical protein